MKKNIILGVIILVIGAGAFVGGMKYASSTGSLQANVFQQNGIGGSQQTNGGFAQMGRNGATGKSLGNMVNGEILSKDDKSITIKLRNGGSQFIFFSPSTQIMKSTTGGSDDLKSGLNISANGTSNSDGSITAQSIQIRPAGEAFPGAMGSKTQESTTKN
jgi:hypothetical protein